MCHTQGLSLYGNKIGDAGLTALAKAVESGALPQLKDLYLDSNQVGDIGLSALAEACASGALAQLTSIAVFGNPASEAAQQVVQDAIRNRQ
jgi:hypothetical protein